MGQTLNGTRLKFWFLLMYDFPTSVGILWFDSARHKLIESEYPMRKGRPRKQLLITMCSEKGPTFDHSMKLSYKKVISFIAKAQKEMLSFERELSTS